MSISYFDGRTHIEARPLHILMLLNAAYMLAGVLAWPLAAEWLAEPLEWAFAQRLDAHLDLLSYPYTMLWLIPLACLALTALAMRLEMELLARITGITPTFLLGMTYAWYYLLPVAWR